MLNSLSPSTYSRLKEDGSGSAYDEESMAIIKLNNTTVLYLKEVTKFLALVCILREESFERKGEQNGLVRLIILFRQSINLYQSQTSSTNTTIKNINHSFVIFF